MTLTVRGLVVGSELVGWSVCHNFQKVIGILHFHAPICVLYGLSLMNPNSITWLNNQDVDMLRTLIQLLLLLSLSFVFEAHVLLLL